MGDKWRFDVRVRKALVHYLVLSLNVFLDSGKFRPEEQPLIVVNRGEIEPFVFG